jgi:hypothetical protein
MATRGTDCARAFIEIIFAKIIQAEID